MKINTKEIRIILKWGRNYINTFGELNNEEILLMSKLNKEIIHDYRLNEILSKLNVIRQINNDVKRELNKWRHLFCPLFKIADSHVIDKKVKS